MHTASAKKSNQQDTISAAELWITSRVAVHGVEDTAALSLGSLLPEVKLAWEHDLNGSPISSNATLQGVNFATSTPRTAQDGAEASLGATLQRTDALSLRAEYDGNLRSDFQFHTGLLKSEWKF